MQPRWLGPGDAPAYKRLRDAMLALHPSAFTSDAETERARTAASYFGRLGTGPEASCFTLGTWRDDELVAALSCERDKRPKVRHVGHLVGMMVHPSAERQGIGRALLDSCLARLRDLGGVHQVTLSVTADNHRAVALYARAGFRTYGIQPDAIRVDGRYHDKALMRLRLD